MHYIHTYTYILFVHLPIPKFPVEYKTCLGSRNTFSLFAFKVTKDASRGAEEAEAPDISEKITDLYLKSVVFIGASSKNNKVF